MYLEILHYGETLGLNRKDLTEVFKNITTIINSGALVKHYGKEKEFLDINVKGTENIIKFCQKCGKRLIHMSTISVSGNGEKEERIVETPENINDKKIFTEHDLYIGQKISGIYSSTKFKAEMAILEAIYQGLDAQILRLGTISNRYSDGVFQKNIDDNAFAKRLKSFIEIGAYPKYMLAHAIELSPVDLTAQAIIRILNHKSDCNTFHILNPNLLPVKLFINTILSMGIDIIPVSEQMLIDIISGILIDDKRKDLTTGIIHDLSEDKKLIYTSNIRINLDFTINYLKNIGFLWKKIDKNYIIRYINYFKKIGFIKF